MKKENFFFLFLAVGTFFCNFATNSFADNSYKEGVAKFGFPDVSSTIGVIVDQMPDMTEAQIRFAATHYVGSQKLALPLTINIRKYNPLFLVTHYHLGIWEQQPAIKFIIDGSHWGNDWDIVNAHEDWFWHNEAGSRVTSSHDGKYLMNIMNLEFQNYWKSSILAQIHYGAYQAVFLDSSSVDLLQGEASKSDQRLAGTAAISRNFAELGGRTWSQAYALFMKSLTDYLEANGFATIPNIGGQMTAWDKTDYLTSASGAFIEGAFMTNSNSDWIMAAQRVLRLASLNKIVIFQPYLKSDSDISTRMYYLACYLLLKGRYTYINYFHKTPLSWFPEYAIRIGNPLQSSPYLINLMMQNGVFKRDFELGQVFVNPSDAEKMIVLQYPLWQVLPQGGGSLDTLGTTPGTLQYVQVSSFTMPPWSGVVLLNQHP